MNYQNLLLSKNGLAALKLAKEFIKYPVGSKIPTVTQLSQDLEIGRGTLQSSLTLLQTTGAIRLESRGHVGTYLLKKNTSILFEIANISSIVGVMPLPYSKKYEGLASALIVAMENNYNIPVSMAYMRGATNRIAMLLSDRYDFAVVSKNAALKFMNKHDDIVIVKSLGVNSYLSGHAIIFNNSKATKIVDGMKVGLDLDSIDQKLLTEQACDGINVDYVAVEYSQILKRVISGDIEAAIWNKDEIVEKLVEVNHIDYDKEDSEYTEAVIVVRKNRTEIISLLEEMINIDSILKIQNLVMEGKITPSY